MEIPLMGLMLNGLDLIRNSMKQSEKAFSGPRDRAVFHFALQLHIVVIKDCFEISFWCG